jgi:hypothetical protein
MQELESVDFYLEQGYTDIARDTLDMLERQYGVSEETARRRGRLSPVAADGAQSPAAESFAPAAAETFADFGGFDLPAEPQAAVETPVEFRIDEQAFVMDAEEPKAGAPALEAPEVVRAAAQPEAKPAEKGMPRAAVLWFKRALAIPVLSEDESQALRYDLAAAYELSGDIDRAIGTFSEVYGVDVSYRGVAERLRELQQRLVTSNK